MGQILSCIFCIIRKCLCCQDQKVSDYTKKNSSLPISTPEFLESLIYTNSSFKLHQNFGTAVCIDIEQESSQDSPSSSSSSSAHVLGVDDSEDRINGGSDDKNKHSSLSISPPESLESLTDTNTSFELHQNGIDVCIDFVQESSQGSASSAHVLGVNNLEETKNGGSDDKTKHSSVPISTPEFLESQTDANSSFKLHQNGTAICIDTVQESSEDSASAYVFGVNNLEETRNEGPEKWFRHYCSSHKMLLVGEGDFSFSASLAVAFGSAKNMVATSLNSQGFLSRNYKKAMSNIHELRARGCTVLHGVDATEMADHASVGGNKFDRIIYNFPHAGFLPNEPRESQIRRHQLLVSLFFRNAKQMIDEYGEVHLTHKCYGFFLAWNLEGLASAVGLRLVEKVPFNYTDYPGYRTKYGCGGNKNFNSNPSKTYKFGLVADDQGSERGVNERE